MASWADLAAFVRSRYRVVAERADEIRILVEFDDERSQTVMVFREMLDRRDEWVQIASPCGLAGDVDLHDLLVEIGATAVVGGAAIIGEHVVVRHSLPLANLDTNEFVDPLHLVATTADELEEKFFGGDGY
ncbi:YbjN domain-containing protein [Gandjariella thermophila]|uniref:Uncharacterized protein n=1 Tax=Gandjariella thermophila TaxID=1931992 RepID=A0A4D4JDP5_9PSEU|nr:YbjN domain-containing protein [Gandjariella thermophila]GDY32479.1 hypothetical protein GTS_41120 [Gandjariella thermophila]